MVDMIVHRVTGRRGIEPKSRVLESNEAYSLIDRMHCGRSDLYSSANPNEKAPPNDTTHNDVQLSSPMHSLVSIVCNANSRRRIIANAANQSRRDGPKYLWQGPVSLR